jgi:hypothetical protein
MKQAQQGTSKQHKSVRKTNQPVDSRKLTTKERRFDEKENMLLSSLMRRGKNAFMIFFALPWPSRNASLT